jgi:hypothetical protein
VEDSLVDSRSLLELTILETEAHNVMRGVGVVGIDDACKLLLQLIFCQLKLALIS